MQTNIVDTQKYSKYIILVLGFLNFFYIIYYASSYLSDGTDSILGISTIFFYRLLDYMSNGFGIVIILMIVLERKKFVITSPLLLGLFFFLIYQNYFLGTFLFVLTTFFLERYSNSSTSNNT